jgi:ABC-type antimicrobial peptide transport system permease subunit
MMTIDEQLLSQMGSQRFGMTVLGALGAIALLLAVIGVYVLAETTAAGRRREMGIRAALGASGWQLGMVVLRESTWLVGLGILTGLGLAYLSAEMVRSFLFQIEPLDPLTLVAVAGCLLLLAILTGLRPALAASRLDVARTLREK